MSWEKILNHLFDKYCVEGNDPVLDELMKEHDKKIKDNTIFECLRLYADWHGYNYQNQGYYRLLKEALHTKDKQVIITRDGNVGIITRTLYEGVDGKPTDKIYCYEAEINGVEGCVIYPSDIKIILNDNIPQNNNLNIFSLEDLKLAKELADLNWDIEDESNVGFEYENRWITNPFVDLNGGQFDFTNLEGMRQYYGKENVDMFLTQILKKDKDAELENYDIDLE